MNIKAIVELDDSSHNRQDRKERDDFVDLILRSVGYKVIHTKYIDYNILTEHNHHEKEQHTSDQNGCISGQTRMG